MLFNSFEFFIFFIIIYFAYWFVFSKTKSIQNIFLLVASYVFYIFWDWRFSFLLAFSTFLNYIAGRLIDAAKNTEIRKFYMRFVIIVNIGILGYFKYFNFFIDSFISLINKTGFNLNPWALNIILPIGISFFTFHGISYILDIYYGRVKSDKNFIDYGLFVSYFPLLVAGPIERATHLLPQLKTKRKFTYDQGVEGCQLILMGMFKKIVIADALSTTVNDIFLNYATYSSSTLVIGVLAFAFQVYGDFSGYTDIARGISKLLGIELILNFNFPYFSKSIPEFWSRWHISLSSWLNDYVFTPLALSLRQYGRHGITAAIIMTFLISGFWHGAAWHFVIWGMFHGLMYIPYIYSKKGTGMILKKKSQKIILKDVPSIILTFFLVNIGYVFFRAETVFQALDYLNKICTSTIVTIPKFANMKSAFITFFLLFLFIIFEWINRSHPSIFTNSNNRLVYILRWIFYVITILLIALYIQKNDAPFIYFKF
jgi:alginate O-acetyltransferase complex protein AlgI